MFDILCYDNNFAGINIASVSSNSYISDVTDFEIIKGTSVCMQSKFATMEHNKWRLDGSYRILEDIHPFTSDPRSIVTKLAYWSNYMSNDNGTFASAPYIEIKFASDMDKDTVSGITIVAGDKDDYCTAATITIYSGISVVKTYNTTSDTYILSQKFDIDTAFTSIRITFTKTNKPNRFVRLSAIKLKNSTRLSEDNFFDIKILEQISIISDTLPIGTLQFTVKATRSEISKLSEYKYMELYKDCKQFGGYYLDDITKVADDKYTVTLNDAVGVLDTTSQDDTLYITALDNIVSVADVMADILNGTKIPYIISEDYTNSKISIEMKNNTKRTALAKILYVTNSTCKKLRNGALWIGKLDTQSNVKDINNKMFDDYNITDNVPVLNLSMQRNIISKGSDEQINNPSMKVISKTKDSINIKIQFPAIIYALTINSLTIDGYFKTTYADGTIHQVRFRKSDHTNIIMTRGSNTVTMKIDRTVLRNSKDSVSWWVKEFQKWLSRSGGTWGERLTVINNADFSTFNVITLHGDFTLSNAQINTGEEYDVILNPNIKSALKTQDLQIQTVPLAYLMMNNITEYDSQQISETVEQTDGSETTIKRTENTNEILPKLMDRYYKYNREFDGTILAEGLECGDTVSMNLRDVGYTTGTITQLEYNLTNKEIARAKIWLYESEAET